MIWALMIIGVLFLLPLFFKVVAIGFKIFFAIVGPLLIVAMVVLLLLGIIF